MRKSKTGQTAVLLRLIALLVFISIWTDIARSEIALKGEAKRPFPSLMPLDYPYCRAQAWIDALRKAEEIIPPEVAKTMKFLKLEGYLANMALCALACPVEVVTPEETEGDIISVYLQEPASGAFKKVLDKPGLLILQTGLLFDTFSKINFLARNWPQSLAEASEEMPVLEKETKSLEYLWQFGIRLESFLAKTPGARLEELEEISPFLPDSAVINFLLAQAYEQTHMPQAAILAADRALETCLNGEEETRDKLMAAQIYHVRALALWQMNQPALAETDLETASSILEASGIKWDILPKIRIAHGQLKALRKDWLSMCKDFIAACALGECHYLSMALANGYCNAGEAENDKPLTPDSMSDSLP